MVNKKKLTPEQVQAIKERLRTPYWGIQTHLAEEFNVSRNLIQRIQKDMSIQEDTSVQKDMNESTGAFATALEEQRNKFYSNPFEG